MLAFYEAALVKYDADTARTCLGARYIQHNPTAPDGVEGVMGLIKLLKEKYPQRSSSIKRVMADGDLVMLHVHSKPTPDDRGTAIVDRVLASTGAARSRFTPEVPTFAEQKVVGLEARDWFGIYIAGTPSGEVVSSVGAMVRAAASSPAYAQALLSSSLEAALSTQEELNRLARADSARWAPIVKASGFVADV